MSIEKLRNTLVAFLLSFTAALGAAGSLATAMGLEVNWVLLTFGCFALAGVFSFAFQTKYWTLPLAAVLILAILWWREGTLRYSLEGMVYTITDLYDRGYGWGVLQWSDWHQLLSDATPALLLVALPVVVAVSATTAGGYALLGAVPACLPLVLCLLLKDTVPAPFCLAILLFALVIILLTHGVRRRSRTQADLLSLMLLLPVTLGLLALFLCVPKDTYHGQDGAQALENMVKDILHIQEEIPLPQMTAGDQEKQVQLDQVGKRENGNGKIMTVKAQTTGTLYLRGAAYDYYDGKTWRSTPGWNSWSLFYSSNSSTLKSVTIQTEDVHSVMYFTYAPSDNERRVVGGRIRNDQNLKVYTMRYRDPVTYDPSLDSKTDEVGGEQLAEYLQLPEDTRVTAQSILRGRVGIPTETTNAGQTWKNAQYIASWVSSRAKYNLNASKMPVNEPDFALWFMEKAKTGYCTHFATACTVLLRAAGIPAQYVTGYMVEAEAGRTTTVTEKHAHAWVEAFINGVGWVVLEPTPGGQTGTYTPPEQTEPRPTEDTPTAPTEAEATEQTTVSTQPTQTSAAETVGGETQMPSTAETAGLGGADSPDAVTVRALSPVLKAVLVLVTAVVLALAVVVQWRLRVAIRYGRLHRGDSNKMALHRWGVVERMAHFAGEDAPEEAYWIAQKARFSPHTISREELRTLDEAAEQLRCTLRSHGLHKRVIYTLILALY